MGHPFKLPSRRRDKAHGYVAGTLSTGDGKDGFCIPWSAARLIGFVMAVDDGGSSSGSTSVMVNRVRDESDTAMFSAVLSIAHGAATVSAEKNHADLVAGVPLLRGDIVRVDIDAVPGSASAGLAWTAIFHIDKD